MVHIYKCYDLVSLDKFAIDLLMAVCLTEKILVPLLQLLIHC